MVKFSVGTTVFIFKPKTTRWWGIINTTYILKIIKQKHPLSILHVHTHQ